MFRYVKNDMGIREKAVLENVHRVASLIEEVGMTKTVEQSDKLGSDWVIYTLGNVELRREYVEQENPMGTADNPIEWTEDVWCIPNGFYTFEGVRKVWMGAKQQGASWDDAGWAIF